MLPDAPAPSVCSRALAVRPNRHVRKTVDSDAAGNNQLAFSSDVNNALGAYITPDQIAALRLVVNGSSEMQENH